MKLDCPDVGRSIIEDWLAWRGQFGELQEDGEGYEKVLDIYCLHVLPQLEEWDYAREFLQHENELPQEKRAVCSMVHSLGDNPNMFLARHLVFANTILQNYGGTSPAITDTRKTISAVSSLRLPSTFSLLFLLFPVHYFNSHGRSPYTTLKRPNSPLHVRSYPIYILCISSI
jgi:hypothetical protein